MPVLITRREGETIEIGGVPVAVAIARDKSVTLVVGMYDGDGLLESHQDVKRRGIAYRAEVEEARARTC